MQIKLDLHRNTRVSTPTRDFTVTWLWSWSVKFLYTSLYTWSDLMICFDSELFPQNFVWQLNNDQKSLEPHRNCQIKSSKWLYFSFHMSQRIDNIQFYSYESIFLTNFKCSKHFALKKSSELWHSSIIALKTMVGRLIDDFELVAKMKDTFSFHFRFRFGFCALWLSRGKLVKPM